MSQDTGTLVLPKKRSLRLRQKEECLSPSTSGYLPKSSRKSTKDGEAVVKKPRKNHLEGRKDIPNLRKSKRIGKKGAVESSKVTIDQLPPELWMKIFNFAFCSEGVCSFVSRVSQVCRAWRELCRDPSLYHTLDLSVNDHHFLKPGCFDSIARYDLSQCRILSLARQCLLTSKDIKMLLNAAPNITSLDLNCCQCLNTSLVSKDLCKLQKLSRVHLACTVTTRNKISYSALANLVKSCGVRLTELDLFSNECLTEADNLNKFLYLLQTHCPNLCVLEISQHKYRCQSFTEVDMAGFTRACPKLREIRLDGVPLRDKIMSPVPYPGCTHLKVASFRHHSFYGLQDVDSPCFKMLSNVSTLEELHLSNSHFNPRHLTKCLKEVKHLSLSNMYWDYRDLLECIEAWGGSLETLDVSHNYCMLIDDALQILSHFIFTPLKLLNLSETEVTGRGISYVLISCPSLEKIDLRDCPRLPLRNRHVFEGIRLKELHDELKSGALFENVPAYLDSSDSSDFYDSDDELAICAIS